MTKKSRWESRLQTQTDGVDRIALAVSDFLGSLLFLTGFFDRHPLLHRIEQRITT